MLILVTCGEPPSGAVAPSAPLSSRPFGALETMMPAQYSLRGPFKLQGYIVLRDVLPAGEFPALRAEADQLLAESSERGGVRNILSKSLLFTDLASSTALSSIAEVALGPEARPTKLTVFDKTPGANWNVPWHQDLTITLNERVEVPGYGPWRAKDLSLVS